MKSSRALAVVAVVAVAAGGGYLLQRNLGSAPDTVAPAPVATNEAPPTEAPPSGPTVPETLPQFELKDREGTPRKLAHWAGRPLVVNYWATWCPPCIREIPLLSKLRQDYAAQKLEVVGIAVDFRDDVLAFAAKRNVDYPLMIGEDDGVAAVSAVGMEPTFPFTIFADSKQRIVTLKVGELHADEAKLILDEIMRIEAGESELAASRALIDEGLKTIAARRATEEAAKEAAKT